MIEKNVFGWLMEHNDITNVNMKKRGWDLGVCLGHGDGESH